MSSNYLLSTIAFFIVDNILVPRESDKYGTIHLRRRHALGGEGGSPLPMFADARGGGVLGLPTSAINPQ